MSYTGEQKRAYDRQWQAQRRERAVILLGGVCAWCGSVEQLEFDHIDPSAKDPKIKGQGFPWSWSWERVLAELAKCWLLCKNCHRIKTRDDRPEVLHGSSSMWHNHGCRCTECRAWMAASKRDYRARRAQRELGKQ